MADVFISYAREDRDCAQLLARALEAKGWSVWWDDRINVGHSFSKAIALELDRARCVIVLWSRHSLDSEWVHNEAAEAANRNALVPVRIEDVRPPLEFRRLQTADFLDWRNGFHSPAFDACVQSISLLAEAATQFVPVPAMQVPVRGPAEPISVPAIPVTGPAQQTAGGQAPPNSRWLVEPQAFDFQVSGWRESTASCSTAGCLGCSSLFVAVCIVSIATAYFTQLRSLGSSIWWPITMILTGTFLLASSLAVYYSRTTSRLKTEALKATTEARARYHDIRTQVGTIDQSVRRAAQALALADNEFKNHRFAPFWDAMEAAVTAIGECHGAQQTLAADIDQYVGVLEAKRHDFPSWDTAVTTIPDVAPLLTRFVQLKSSAEADYQFASMREFRETRQVMIAGFRTLGEALRNMENAVTTSIGNLKSAVDRSVARRAADPVHLNVVAGFLVSRDTNTRR